MIAKWSNASDCKSAGIRLRRFDSYSQHHFGNKMTPKGVFSSHKNQLPNIAIIITTIANTIKIEIPNKSKKTVITIQYSILVMVAIIVFVLFMRTLLNIDLSRYQTSINNVIKIIAAIRIATCYNKIISRKNHGQE